MGLADLFSGGEDSDANGQLEALLQNLSNVNAPTAQNLTLPQLKSFVQAGILTPEQADAYTQSSNAYDSTTADNSGLDTELSTIGQLNDIVNAGGNDPEEQANIQAILNSLNTTESGNNAAILRDAAARGVSNSGTTLAARLASNQNDATNANANAESAAGTAEARNLSALNAVGALGGAVQGQEYTQAANKANAANAIAAFNAQQKQQVGNLNTTTANDAQAANLAEAQSTSDKNTLAAQQQQESVPAAQQLAFNDALEKAGATSGVAENLAGQQVQEGEQTAGEIGGLISDVGNAYTGGLFSNVGTSNTGGTSTDTPPPTDANGQSLVASGGRIMPGGGVARPMNMKSGGPVPGKAVVPGDSTANDNVRADLSPDEIVVPRTAAIPAMQGDFSKTLQFLKSLPKPAPRAPMPAQRPGIHPKAVLDTLRALSAHHAGAV